MSLYPRIYPAIVSCAELMWCPHDTGGDVTSECHTSCHITANMSRCPTWHMTTRPQIPTKYNLLWSQSHWNYTGKCIFVFVFHIPYFECRVWGVILGRDRSWWYRPGKRWLNTRIWKMNSCGNFRWIGLSDFSAYKAGSAAIAVTESWWCGAMSDILILRHKHGGERNTERGRPGW